MKLSCSVSVGNRLLPALAIRSNQKHVKSTLALCKAPKSSAYCIILFSSQAKNGTKYEVKNISKVLTRFVNEGKATIQFKIPQHDLYVQADPIILKSFLHLLKRAVENKISDKELTCSSMSVTPVKETPKKLVIEKRSDYPLKGFSRTLEVIHINNIRRCSLDRGVLQLPKLRVLDISHNNIDNLPVELANMQCLVELNVSHNELNKSTLKQWSWLGGRLSKTLKLLNISNNKLNILPDQIIKLHSLISLHLDNNEIKVLPSGIGSLRHLQIFTASNNQITYLPGSIKKWKLENLDLSNNQFNPNEQCNPAAIFPKHLPVWSLKDYASRRVLQLEIDYTPPTLPATVIDYLGGAKYCVCGCACFNIFIRQEHMVSLTTIGRTVNVSSDGLMYVPMECYFCSLKCFSSLYYNRKRQPFI